MAYDPLTGTTRRTRTVLFVASSGLLFTTIFNVQVTSIPLNGINIGIEQGLIKTILLLITLFNLVYFMIYFVDDVIYLKKPDVLSQNNTDIRNQMANLDQYVLESTSSREMREASIYYNEKISKKTDETLKRLKQVRQEVYERILEPRGGLHPFSKFRIFAAEAAAPVILGLFSTYAAIQPVLPGILRSSIVTSFLSIIRDLSIQIGSTH